ncbi:MAG: hypothetical protein V4725_08320 [Bacteroidota bacterium]
MKKYLLKYAGVLLLSGFIMSGVQAQSKASQRSLASEMTKLKEVQNTRRNMMANINHGGQGNGHEPTLPPAANHGQGNQQPSGRLKKSQQAMPTPPARITKKNKGG